MTKLAEINLNVDEYTTPTPVTVSPDMGLHEVMEIMAQDSYRHLPVVEAGRAIGMISDRDLKMLNNLEFAKKYTAREFMVENPVSVQAGSSLSEVVYKMAEDKIGSVIVNDENGEITGIFTSTDALNALVEILRGEILD